MKVVITLIVFGASLALAGTLAKPLLEHDLGAKSRAQLEAEVQPFLALTEANAVALVPVQTPFITSDCPACGHGHYTRELDRNLWKFAPPDRITCVKCGVTFPTAQFPLDDRAAFLNTPGDNRHDEFVSPIEWPSAGRTVLDRSRNDARHRRASLHSAERPGQRLSHRRHRSAIRRSARDIAHREPSRRHRTHPQQVGRRRGERLHRHRIAHPAGETLRGTWMHVAL